jgi:hypothetical protein
MEFICKSFSYRSFLFFLSNQPATDVVGEEAKEKTLRKRLSVCLSPQVESEAATKSNSVKRLLFKHTNHNRAVGLWMSLACSSLIADVLLSATSFKPSKPIKSKFVFPCPMRAGSSMLQDL